MWSQTNSPEPVKCTGSAVPHKLKLVGNKFLNFVEFFLNLDILDNLKLINLIQN